MAVKKNGSVPCKTKAFDVSRLERIFEKARLLKKKQICDFVYQLHEVNSESWYPELVCSLEESAKEIRRNPVLLWTTTSRQIGMLKHQLQHLRKLIKYLERLNKKVFDFEPFASMSDKEFVEKHLFSRNKKKQKTRRRRG